MSFKIEDDNVLVKYNEIWNRMSWWNRMLSLFYDRDISEIRTR